MNQHRTMKYRVIDSHGTTVHEGDDLAKARFEAKYRVCDGTPSYQRQPLTNAYLSADDVDKELVAPAGFKILEAYTTAHSVLCATICEVTE